MSKVKNVWVVASGSTINELTTGAAQYGETVTLVYAGDKASAVNADKAYYMGEASMVIYAAKIASMVAEAKPELVLFGSNRDGRLAAAHVAVACKTSVQADAAELIVEDGAVTTSKMVYGGAATRTEKSGEVAVVCVGPGVMSAGEAKPAAEIVEVNAEADSRIKLVEKRAKVGSTVNLSAAKKVVGVGRGLADEAALEACKKLAETIGAEMGCTRPICEERKWMDKELYIGVSGVVVQPDTYVSIGISGQVQHVVGMNKSGTIIAIDKNEGAPIFKACDYGIVGDLHKIVPALQKLIEG